MKKILHYISFLTLAVSCQTPIFLEPIGPEKELVLQARLLTSDEQHTVYASYALHDQLIPAKDLTLNCFVNGQLVAVGEGETGKSSLYTTYQFTATIQPGDSVRIEAIGEEHRAVAKVKAPKTLPDTPNVTVKRVIVYDQKGNARTLIRFSIPVQDIPNENNWYRINPLKRNIADIYVSEEYLEDNPWYPYEVGWNRLWEMTESIFLSNSKDPILNPDGREVEYLRPDYMANSYQYFTDELFEDGCNAFTLEVNPSKYISHVTAMSMEFRYRNTITAIFDIQSMSREDFMNSRMLEMDHFDLSGIGLIDDLFSEDMVLPENVEGGIGLVTVRSVTRATCDLGIIEYDVNTGFPKDLNF